MAMGVLKANLGTLRLGLSGSGSADLGVLEFELGTRSLGGKAFFGSRLALVFFGSRSA